ncbi:MAG: DUF3137 domain-containing protein [Clostridium sp.]|nr:DUF3137 domain-containing protein [Clostridium sp.]MCM1458508.1 DUF3137 domain-containing protein [Bacteroides sp.]
MNDVNYGVSDLETLRKRAQLFKRLRDGGFVVLFISLWIVPLIMFQITGGTFLAFLFYAIYAIVEVYFLKSAKKTKKIYIKAYKEALVVPSLAKNFQKYTYRPEGQISKDEIMSLGLWNQQRDAYEVSSEDLLTGTYKDVYYEQGDLNVRFHSNNGKVMLVFYGAISKFRFNKKVSGRLIVTTEKNSQYFSANGLPAIETENQEFNYKFGIYAEEGHDAFYVLTPHFMEYVLKLYETVPHSPKSGREMVIMFDGNSMTILRSNVRMFEVSLEKEFDYFKLQQEIISDMDKVLSVVDILNIGREELPQEKATQKEAVEQENKTENNGAVAKFRLK